MYLKFGLLPGIVLHVAFDTVWFALPLFVSRAPGIWVDRTLVVVLALVPLWVVLLAPVAGRTLARARTRPEKQRLAPGRPTGAGGHGSPGATSFGDAIRAGDPRSARRGRRGIARRGGRGMVARSRRAASARLPRDGARTRHGGGGRARGAPGSLVAPARDGRRGAGRTPRLRHAYGRHREYRRLLGTYLPAPRWRIRAARFEGDLAARAEEWGVAVDARGEAVRVRHTLPEGAAGVTLSAEEARQLAYATVRTRFGLDAPRLREVAVSPSKLPARTDWLVTFEDRSPPALSQGELRVSVAIAGGEVTDAWRFVHVPEEWERAERERRTAAGVFNAAGTALLGGLLLGFAAVTLVAWSRGGARVHDPLRLFLVLGGVRGLAFANEWPARLAGFSTAQPFGLQAAQLAVALLVGAGVVAAIAALAAGDVRLSAPGPLTRAQAARMGLGAGGVACAVLALGALLRAGAEPTWPSMAGAATAVPPAALPLAAVFGFGLRTVIVALVFAAADRLSDGWSVHRVRAGAVPARDRRARGRRQPWARICCDGPPQGCWSAPCSSSRTCSYSGGAWRRCR